MTKHNNCDGMTRDWRHLHSELRLTVCISLSA